MGKWFTFFHFHQNKLFAQCRTERSSVITGGLKTLTIDWDHFSWTLQHCLYCIDLSILQIEMRHTLGCFRWQISALKGHSKGLKIPYSPIETSDRKIFSSIPCKGGLPILLFLTLLHRLVLFIFFTGPLGTAMISAQKLTSQTFFISRLLPSGLYWSVCICSSYRG